VSEDATVERVAALLEDETVRTILTETSVTPMSATELSERCPASQPTIYRRLDDLRALDLIDERTRPDPDEGHHRQVYVPTLDHVRVDLRDGTLEATVARREDMADRFTRLVEGM
jgi:DNA-binding transcriptional ArsR family regulator